MKTEAEIPLSGDAQIRATAWALEQLNAADLAAFEQEIAASPALASYAREMRAFSALVATEMPADDGETARLPALQRDKVTAALNEARSSASRRRSTPGFWKWTAAASAAAVLVIGLFFESWSRSLNVHSRGQAAERTMVMSSGRKDTPPEEEFKFDRFATPQTATASPDLYNVRLDSAGNAPQPGTRGMGLLVSDDAAKSDFNKSRLGENLPLISLAASSYPAEQANTESYKSLPANIFQEVTQAPLSTFSIDVDTASYANVRRFLNQGLRPPAEAVRLEEMVNYFPYDIEPPPPDGKPFAVRVDIASAPWQPAHRLARIVLKGREIAKDRRPPSNLVFLVDVSGSMAEPNKLPLVQQSLRLLTERLTENDRVALVTYAGSSAVVLPSTNGAERARILAAVDSLSSGGGTNGAGGISAAYEQAAAHFIKEGVNRVILATDGDFNIGATGHDDLRQLIADRAKSGVFLSVLGYGMGNLKDDTMELLADRGNGNYAYIDSLSEARKALVEQMDGTLITIAKDVKIQVEFNPAAVRGYRLLGYENRLLTKEDFNNDKKDAGEIGAGHTVTALYEIIPAGQPETPVPVVDGLKYQQTPAVIAPRTEVTAAALSGEMMTVKLRWKQPDGEVSELLETPVKDSGGALEQAAPELRWAAAVAGFTQLLRGEGAGGGALTWEAVRSLARGAKGADPLGYRGEFLQLIDKAESLSR